MSLRTVTLGVRGPETTVLGFGCANLFRLPRAAQRLALLEAAFDAGVRHFDVAPMYGLGLAEAELGRFARGRRHQITIATKFGITPSPASRVIARGQGPARRILEAVPTLRQYARSTAAGPNTGRLGTLIYSAEGYSAAVARRSLEHSLRALGTDYIDFLLLHNPAPGTVPSEELDSYLREVQSAGMIRSWGIAGEPPEPTIEIARSFGHAVPVLQLRDNIFLRSLRRVGSVANAFVTFGLLGETIDRLVRHVTENDERHERWNALIGADCGEPDVAASLLLRAALRENSSGVVLFSTTRSRRILSAVTAAEVSEAGPSSSLNALSNLLDSELRGGQYAEEGRT